MAYQRLSYDWTSLREEWIDRRMSGDPISLRGFREEVAGRRREAGAKPCGVSTWERHTRGWDEERRRREELLQEDLAHDSSMDFARQRRKLVRAAERAHELVMVGLSMVEAQWAAIREQEQDPRKWGVTATEVKRVADIEVAARQAAGLPKTFELGGKLEVEDRPGEAAGDLVDHARSLREYLDRKRAGRPVH